MKQTLDNLKKKILDNVNDPTCTEIYGIEKSFSTYCRTSFFGISTYKIYRVKDGFSQVLTEFDTDAYALKLLDYLNEVAKDKLPKGKTHFQFYDKAWDGSAVPSSVNFDNIMKIHIDAKTIEVIRTDTDMSQKFDTIEDLIATVFPEEDDEDNPWNIFQKGVAKAIREYKKVSERTLKSAMTQVKTAKKRLTDLEKAIEGTPDSIKLLLEIGA